MTRVSSKDGDHEVKGAPSNGSLDDLISSEAPRQKANPIAGEISFVDHLNRTHILRPTFEAALEIEEATGIAIDGLRNKFAMALQPTLAPTTREYGIIIAAGIRAAGEPKVDAGKAARLAWEVGRRKLRPVLLEFLRALCDGGRGRADDLGKGASSTDSRDVSPETTAEMIQELERRSAATSGSPL